MLKRRLILLFAIVVMVAIAIGARLAILQIVQAKEWKARAQSFNYRHFVIPSVRGEIIDARGHVLAAEQPCYDLAIDYQAMNRDDSWINRTAIERLRPQYHNWRALVAHLPAMRRAINDDLAKMPARIARHCGISLSDVLERFDIIRSRMRALREDIWTLRYGNDEDVQADASPDAVDLDMGMHTRINLAEAHTAHTIVPAIPPAVAFYFKKHADEYPGLVIVPSTVRQYRYGSVAAQVIGALGQVTPDELKADAFRLPRLIPGKLADTPGNLQGYLPGDETGAFGVEYAAEKALRGDRGVKLVDLSGHEVMSVRRNPVPGKTIRLTLDIKLQREIQRSAADPKTGLFDVDGVGHPAAAVVLKVRNSHVLAMLSLPSYNLNSYHQDYDQLLKNPNLPLLNRAVASAYPPGSTVKPLLAAWALSHGVISPETTIVCHGYLFPGHPHQFRCWAWRTGGHGPENVVQAIEHSCDVFFYTVGMRLGYNRLIHIFRAYGLGRYTGVGLPEETTGYLPRKRRGELRASDRTNSIFMGIGQGPIAFTPLQMAGAYATLLRGGVWMPVTLMRGLPAPPLQRPNVRITSAALAEVEAGMNLVVHGAGGTARALQMALPVAGKTGTAQTAQVQVINGKKTVVKGDDGWFVGYVPAENPKYVIAAVVEMGGEGGASAALLVRQCVLALETRGYLPKVDKP